MKKANKKIISLLIVLFIVVVAGGVLGFNYIRANSVKTLVAGDIKDIDFAKANKLMIVAHPDDEVIWGGGHLMDKDYLVVCITNGRNKVRSEEFKKVIEKSGNQGIILSYPDKVNKRRSSWKRVKSHIRKDIDFIISQKNWDMIVTHNSKGEYGHNHHIMTHNIVVDSYKAQKSDAKLMFFGTFYTKKTIGDHEKEMQKISDERLKFKTELSKLYESQSGTVDVLWHMAPYEEFTTYDEKNNT